MPVVSDIINNFYMHIINDSDFPCRLGLVYLGYSVPSFILLFLL
jgi:hypothetical protein